MHNNIDWGKKNKILIIQFHALYYAKLTHHFWCHL